MNKINPTFHSIAIVTKDIKETQDYFQTLLGLSIPSSTEYEEIHHVDQEGVEHKFTLLQIGSDDYYIELFEPVSGPHREILDDHGHLSVAGFCLTVDDITSAYDRMNDIGIEPVDESGNSINKKFVEYPTGSRGFFLPKDVTGEMLIEFLQPYYNIGD